MATALSSVGSKAGNIFKKKNPAMQTTDQTFNTNVAKPYMDNSTGTPINTVEQNAEVANKGFWMGQDGTSQTAKTFTNLSGLALLGGGAANVFRNMQSEKSQIEEYRNKEQQALSKNAYDTLNSAKTMSGQVGQNVMDQANVAGRTALQSGLAKMHNTGGEGNMAAIAGAASDKVYADGAMQASGMQSQILGQGHNSFAQQMSDAENKVQNLYKGDDPYAAAASGAANIPYALNEASKLGLESIQNRDLTHNARIKETQYRDAKPLDMTKTPSTTATPWNPQDRSTPGTSTVDNLLSSSNTMQMLGLQEKNPDAGKPFYELGKTPFQWKGIVDYAKQGINAVAGIPSAIGEGIAEGGKYLSNAANDVGEGIKDGFRFFMEGNQNVRNNRDVRNNVNQYSPLSALNQNALKQIRKMRGGK